MEFVKRSLANVENNDTGSKLYKKNNKIYLEATSWCAMEDCLDMDKFLSVSYISKDYPRTFLLDGLIFNTKQRPKYWCPINTLKLQTTLESVIEIIQKYKEDASHSNKLINEKIKHALLFFCKSKKEFDKKFPNKRKVLEAFKKIEIEGQGIDKIIENYNEILFDKDIEIEPRAVFYFKTYNTDLNETLKPIKEDVIGLPIYHTAYDRVAKRKPWGKVEEWFFD